MKNISKLNRAQPPFFIVGNPRSGTKMLRELLNISPNLWIPIVETLFIPYLAKNIDRYGPFNRFDSFKLIASDITHTKAVLELKDIGINIDIKEWFEYCNSFDLYGVLESFFHYIFIKEKPDNHLPWENIIWGDKTPTYLGEIKILAKKFHKSRFIHIIRDPRDCCLSAKKVWNKHPLRMAQIWSDYIQKGRTEGKALGPDRYFELHFEDLIENPISTLGNVFQFLGVETPSNTGQLYRVAEEHGDAKGKMCIIPGNKLKWKEQMPLILQRKIESITGDQLTEFGYERIFKNIEIERLNPIKMQLLRFRDVWFQMKFRRKERGNWFNAFKFLFYR